ncbi:phosphatidylserine/phosphatidylglycerophosphate/cardiolipin synthase family protein [bacterium]|nr:phosphatidylserine/phosphatidylglycerophosphate/cardiolipin synthase family protein [bacterium]
MKPKRSVTAFFRRVPPRPRTILLIVAALLLLPLGGLVSDLIVAGREQPNLAARLVATAPPPPTSGGLTLCVDGPEFMASLERDLSAARERALVQTLSFEADEAGYALSAAMVASPAAEKLLLVDAFSRYVVSDKFLYDPTRLLDVPLGEEARATLRLLEHLRAHGVDVRIGRPYGPGEDNLAARDHKKIVVVDDAAYVGGINFSAHNFTWHDLMLRIADAGLADALAADVRSSWTGESVLTTAARPGVELLTGRGAGEADILDRVTRGIDAAQASIYLECPYVTEPYFASLGAARARGVQVTVVTSERINRLAMKQSIMDACRRHDLDLRLTDGEMTHVKAMLVDGETLYMGSANFDFLSSTLQPEVLAVVDDPELVHTFATRVMAPGLAGSWDWPEQRTSPVIGGVSSGIMGLARWILQALHGSQDR